MNKLSFLLLLCAAPAFAGSNSQWAAWTPKGWKLYSASQGDLNKDGRRDAVLVLEQTDPANIKPNDGLGAPQLNLNPRRLLVLLQTAADYQQVLSRDDLLPSANDASNPCLADPLEEGGVSIQRGNLKIALQEWLSCGSYGVTNRSLTYRWENGRFRLIGYDHNEFSRASGEESGFSINYLSGREKRFSDRGGKPTTHWANLPPTPPRYLDEMSLKCAAETNSDAWCR